jgi:hypothetical protein
VQGKNLKVKKKECFLPGWMDFCCKRRRINSRLHNVYEINEDQVSFNKVYKKTIKPTPFLSPWNEWSASENLKVQ